jgi:hypothetical protein
MTVYDCANNQVFFLWHIPESKMAGATYQGVITVLG